MKIGIDMGHSLSGAGTGASSILNEVTENRKIGKEVISLLQQAGHTVVNCTVDKASSVDNQLAGIVNKANAQSLDLFLSIHLNAGGGHGTETYIYNGSYSGKEANRATAKKINDAVVASCGFRNRGVKEANYYVLRQTVAPACLIEVCFVDSQEDAGKLNASKVARAIAEAIHGSAISSGKPPVQAPPTNTSEIYRVRKSWADAASQIGAYKNLDSAKALADKNPGYKVFNSAGVQVYPVAVSESVQSSYAETGKATVVVSSIPVRNEPKESSAAVATYYKGESFNYDKVYITNLYVYCSYVSNSGVRRYVPVKNKTTGQRLANCV